jgi:hypothetical protein
MRVRLIGYWRSDTDDGWPDPRDLIDETWDARERDLVASYLSQGFVPWTAAGIARCCLCGNPNGSAELTDGVFLWPEGLAHYVRDHSVRLPAEVISHITQRLAEMESLDVDGDSWRRLSGR